MNKTLQRILTALFWYALFDAMLLGYAGFIPGVNMAAAQTSLTQTTLSFAVPIGPSSLAGGAQGALSTQVGVASATGIQTAAFGTQPVTYLYVDQELMGVISLAQGQTTIFNVLRALSGTKAAYHASGAMVLIGTQTPQFGGTAGSGGFQQTDPPLGGVCNLANTGLTPWVNIVTGYQWICSSVAGAPGTNGQWIPGWNNPLAAVSPGWGPVTASATALLPPAPFFHLSGTTAATSFLIPVGFNATAVGYGRFCYVTDSTAGATAGNNIAATVTGVAATLQCWYWDPTNAKFYPQNTD
jgi:hypothetical protein